MAEHHTPVAVASNPQGQDTDFIIKVGDNEIPVHQKIVREKSDYFKAMLSHDTLEKQSGIVTMKDVEFEVVKACIDSMYGKNIDITLKNYEELLLVARIIQFTSLCDKISRFLEENLSVKSFFHVKRSADQYFLENLIEACLKFALKNLDVLAKEPEFNQVEMNFIASLITLKKSPNPKCEDAKLAIVLNWVNAERENRCKHLSVLVNLVKWDKISKSYLKYALENEKIFTESKECMNFLDSIGINRTEVVGNTALEAKPAEICFNPEANAILVSDSRTRSFQAYHPASKSISRLCQIHPNENHPHDIVMTDDYIYLYILFEHCKMFRIDLSEDHPTWVEMRSMARDHGWAPRAALHNDYIYMIGNYSGERYSIEKDEWSPVQGHQRYMNGCAVIVCNDSLYTIGEYGQHGEGSKKAQRLCTTTLTWSEIQPMSVQRFSPRGVSNGSVIYVAGGNVPSIEYYDTQTDSWTLLTRMHKVRSWMFGICLFDKMLYTLDAYVIESFDLVEKHWITQKENSNFGSVKCLNVAVFAPDQEESLDNDSNDVTTIKKAKITNTCDLN